MTIDERTLDAILPGVEKPARYTGHEYNSVLKDWDAVTVRLALAFPDIYELGMSNLGLAILYDCVNQRPDMLAERVYLPWVDMQAAMRRARLPLYSLESHRPLREFDLIGLSLPYVQLYTNTLSLLDLADLPLLSAERDARHPLVIAGGSAVYNPEPMADFVDAFVIGEGEEVLLELLDAFRSVRTADRPTQLRRLAAIPGVYVPRFYRPYHAVDGRLLAMEPVTPEAPPRIVKRIVPVLPPPVTRFVVPFVGAVFDRGAVEIQRGCTRGCRFCQAGAVFRPVRERPVGEVVQAVHDIVRHTGYQEVSLLSLSSSDYSHIEDLVRRLAPPLPPRARGGEEGGSPTRGETEDSRTRRGDANAGHAPSGEGEGHTLLDDLGVSLSLPSSRIESVSVAMIDLLSRGRRTGFTFAPEAASDRLRNVINKPIPTAELLELAEAVFSRGWRSLKLYFMIGQPTETDDDVRAIAELARAVRDVGKRHHRGKAQVRVGVSTFVPQPHTPFQWTAMDAPEAIRRKQDLLRQAFGRGHSILFNWNDPQESLLEAALVRGDRRVGQAILSAWQAGCRFDAWREHFKPEAWTAAFAAHGLDQGWYATRVRDADEVLPWDHIETGVARRWLWADYQAALHGEMKVDCRHGCHGCGILTAFTGASDAWQCPPVAGGAAA